MSLNGTSAYAEAPHAAELTSASWTFELWFRDDNPAYNHARTRLLTKGATTEAEVPYFASIGANTLTVGLRSGGNATTATVNLAAIGLTPAAWHHLAASFNSSNRVLTIYIDGVQREQTTLWFASSGNTSPLIVGRSGPGGDYWRGRLDELRLWNLVRTPAEIAGSYRAVIGSAPGLVGSWHFDEGMGLVATDSAGSPQSMTLLGGAGYAGDVPPALATP